LRARILSLKNFRVHSDFLRGFCFYKRTLRFELSAVNRDVGLRQAGTLIPKDPHE